MRYLRYQESSGLVKNGWMLGDKVGEIEGDIFGEYRRKEATIELSTIKLLPPIKPSKIIGVGKNYMGHVKEMGGEMPDSPPIFLKPDTSVIGHKDRIMLPPQSSRVEHEAELAVVIGKTGKWINTIDVESHIFGYTCAADITARDLQIKDGQWTRAKAFDTFCPLGPWIETDLDVSDALITCRVNNEIRQMVSTREMIYTVNQLVVFLSSIMTLLPGDVILTGTPAGVSIINPGDTLEIDIEGIGVLHNSVVTEPVS